MLCKDGDIVTLKGRSSRSTYRVLETKFNTGNRPYLFYSVCRVSKSDGYMSPRSSDITVSQNFIDSIVSHVDETEERT